MGRLSFGHAVAGSRPAVLDWAMHSRDLARTTSSMANVTLDVTPIPCHSHNDYWRSVPLFEALRAGCTSVEADVWLMADDEDELYVGHNKKSLSSHMTLREMYTEPLLEMIDLK